MDSLIRWLNKVGALSKSFGYKMEHNVYSIAIEGKKVVVDSKDIDLGQAIWRKTRQLLAGEFDLTIKHNGRFFAGSF